MGMSGALVQVLRDEPALIAAKFCRRLLRARPETVPWLFRVRLVGFVVTDYATSNSADFAVTGD
jgi:hypothetical protein